MAQARATGMVKWFDGTKGFSFITPGNGSEDLFVHQSSIKSEGYRSLAEGETVEFVVSEGNDGRTKVVDVIGLNGAPVQGDGGHGGYSGGDGGGYRSGGRSGGYGVGDYGSGGVVAAVAGVTVVAVAMGTAIVVASQGTWRGTVLRAEEVVVGDLVVEVEEGIVVVEEEGMEVVAVVGMVPASTVECLVISRGSALT